MGYEVLFLDLDGTFFDFHAAERQAFCRTMAQVGIADGQAYYQRYSSLNESLWKAFERGEIEKQAIRDRRFGQLFAELGIAADGLAAEKQYEAFLGQGHALMPEAEETLAWLAAHFQLYAVTNGFAAVQRSRLQMAGIDRYFTGLFISEEIGCQKPQQGFFDYCFARLPGLSRKKVLLVGDSLTSDIQGARNAGLDCCWFNPDRLTAPAELQPDYEICRLSELQDILQKQAGNRL